MNRITKGTIEAEIAAAVVKFQREQLGRGAENVRVHIIGDLIVVRSTGIFTQIENRLAATEEGRNLIRSSRQELRMINHRDTENIVADISKAIVLRSYCDLSAEAAEMVEIYVLNYDVEKRLLRQELCQTTGLPRNREE